LVKDKICNLMINPFSPVIIAFLPIQAIAANPVRWVDEDEADWAEGGGGGGGIVLWGGGGVGAKGGDETFN